MNHLQKFHGFLRLGHLLIIIMIIILIIIIVIKNNNNNNNNNNLCGKLVSTIELPIKFDERFKVTSAAFFLLHISTY